MKIMGVDLGIRKLAYSVWEDDILVGTYAYESKASSRQAELLDLSDHLYEVVRNEFPDYVFIEETLVGNNTKYSIKLAQVMGAVLSSLALAELEQAIGIYTANVSTWKKEVLGKGNANKDMIREHVMSWDSAYSVLCGGDQDRFDAACIGYYGQLVAKRAVEISR